MKKILLIIAALFTFSFCFAYSQDYVEIKPLILSPENPKVGDTVKITIEAQGYSKSSLSETRMRINYGLSDSSGDTSWDETQIESTVSGKAIFYVSKTYYDNQTYNINVEVCYQKAGAGSWNNETLLVCNTSTASVTPTTVDTKPVTGTKDDESLNPFACETFGECVDTIVNALFYLSIAVVCAAIIIAGILFMTGGTPNRIASAKKILLLGMGIFVIMLVLKFLSSISKNDLTFIKK